MPTVVPFENQEILLELLVTLHTVSTEFPIAAPMLPSLSSSPSFPLTSCYSPPPADGSLHGAVLGQRLASKTQHLDAVAPRVTPLVTVVAGQVQVARGGLSQGEGGLLLRL